MISTEGGKICGIYGKGDRHLGGMGGQSLAGCQAKCEANPDCGFAMSWENGWCELSETCKGEDFQSWHKIKIAACSNVPSPPPAPPSPPPKTCTRVLSTGPKLCGIYGNGDQGVGAAWGQSFGDCQAKCEANAECGFFMSWATGHCELSKTCAHEIRQGGHTIKVVACGDAEREDDTHETQRVSD